MTRFNISTPLRAMLIGALLSTASFVTPATAETVAVMVLNTRGEDGIYRPALRIIRNGTVSFVTPGETSDLTNEILKNTDALNDWLDANITPSQEGGVLNIVIEEPPESEPNCEDPKKSYAPASMLNILPNDMAYLVTVADDDSEMQLPILNDDELRDFLELMRRNNPCFKLPPFVVENGEI
jgi:hypothetical protein